MGDRSARLGGGLGEAREAPGAPDGALRGGGRLGPRGSSRRRSSSPAPGTAVTVFEKADRIGGLLRYGIPGLQDGEVRDRPAAWSRCARKACLVPDRRERGRGALTAVRAAQGLRRRAAVPAAPSSPGTCRCRAASWRACTSRWSSCPSRTDVWPGTDVDPSRGGDPRYRQARRHPGGRRHGLRLHRHLPSSGRSGRSPPWSCCLSRRRGVTSPSRGPWPRSYYLQRLELPRRGR